MIFSHVLYQLSYPATCAEAPGCCVLLGAGAGRSGGLSDAEAGATGLEPATSDVTGRRSDQLSYAPAFAIRLGDYLISLAQTGGRSRI